MKEPVGVQEHETRADELEDLGELGFGSCGHVFKMRFGKTGDVLAVKVGNPLRMRVRLESCACP